MYKQQLTWIISSNMAFVSFSCVHSSPSSSFFLKTISKHAFPSLTVFKQTHLFFCIISLLSNREVVKEANSIGIFQAVTWKIAVFQPKKHSVANFYILLQNRETENIGILKCLANIYIYAKAKNTFHIFEFNLIYLDIKVLSKRILLIFIIFNLIGESSNQWRSFLWAMGSTREKTQIESY